MKKALMLVLLALVAISAGQAHATSTKWVKGNPYYVSEDDATSFLERGFDYVYCSGIPRYGKQGEFPDEEYLVFNCTIELDSGSTCYDVYERSIKGAHPGTYRMKSQATQTKMWCS